MKASIYIVLFLFLSFLAAPTVVSLLQDRDDAKVTAMVSLEEEIQKEIKEVKMVPYHSLEFTFVPAGQKTTRIVSKNPHGHKNVFGDIFLPPPEMV